MLTLFHDYTSPASAVAVARTQRLAAEGLRVGIVGMDVIGVDIALPVTVDVLAELRAVTGQAAAERLALRRPSRLPPTGLAHTVEQLAEARDVSDAWRTRCYAALWRDDADLGDADTLRRLAEAVGLPTDAVDATLDDRLAVLAVRRRSAAVRRDGVGGVPTIRHDRTLVPGLLSDDDLRALAALDPDRPRRPSQDPHI